MQAKRPSIMKNTARAASGGVIVVAALIALMFFRGTGTGEGDAEEAGTPEAGTDALVSTEVPATNPVAPAADSDSTGGLTPDEQKALSGKLLGVLIDEHSYLLEVPDGDTAVFKPTTLERLTELAKRAEGDSNGIKVRVLRRESARVGAEMNLKEALAALDIGEDAIYVPAEFVP